MSTKLLEESFPCRNKEIEQLDLLFGEVSECAPESVFIHGQPATGKTSLVCSYLKTIDAQMAYVNCIECYSPRLMLEKILSGFMVLDTDEVARCDNFMDLVYHLIVARDRGCFKNRSQILVLDGVENLTSCGEKVLDFFSKLQELTSITSLCVLFISRVIPEKFNLTPTTVIHFPQYTKDDLLKIFQLFRPTDITDELYSAYITSALAVFLRTTRDLVEMKTLILKNVSKYVEPITKGDATANDVLLLWRLVTPHLRASLDSAYQGLSQEKTECATSEDLITHKRLKAFDLPYYAKYFLIASYLASYNSPKHDRRLYLKNHGKQRKQAKKEIARTKASELLGPKAFGLDRLLAIFYAIMEEKASLTVNLISQIASLVELRLLTKIGDGNIDNPKFKCLANYDCVSAVADTLGFHVNKYILD